jgi:2-polyprenyl-3-methyl-5-hydroxy-6-metoxy-1,4-benzoquinol methylase
VTDVKDRAFASYVTTHLAPRKGAVTIEVLETQAHRWDTCFAQFLPKDKAARIVDLGCGAGSMVWWLHKRGYSAAEGVDLSAEQVAVAKALGVTNVRQTDLRTYLADAADSFDVVFARDVFEHLDRTTLVRVLDLVHTSLRPGGRLVLQVPNAESPFGGRIRYGDITHELAFTSASVSQLLLMAGFSEPRTYSVEPVVYGVKTFLRLLAWKGVQALYRLLISIEIGRGSRIVSQNLIAVARR